MKRADLLARFRIAGYHGKKGDYTRLFVENRVTRGAAQKQYDAGRAAYLAGKTCSCFECKEINREMEVLA